MRRRRGRAGLPAVAVAAGLLLAAAAPAQTVARYTVTAAGIEAPLTGARGRAERGRRIAFDPELGNCLICHAVPAAQEERFQGDIGPPLAGVGARLSEARLRLRLVDSTRINPRSVMPAYHRVEGLNRVARRWRGQPVLSAAQVEDVVAWLVSLEGAP